MLRSLLIWMLSFSLIAMVGCAGDRLEGEIISALEKALTFYEERQTGGGWATRYSTDLQIQWGEWRPVIPEIVTVQPPGTPMVAEVFLRAYQILGREKYLLIARRAGDLLVKGQQPNGGFPYELWLSPDGLRPVKQTIRMGPPEIEEGWGSLEDGATDAPVGFLLRLFDVCGDSTYFRSALQGADFMVAAQYPSGGWPQLFPPRKGSYSEYYTLNDGVVNDAVCRLIDVYHRTGKQKYIEAAVNGGKWLKRAQLPAPTYGWAEQYYLDMRPAPARAFEAASVSPRAIGWALETFMALYLENNDEFWLEPIPQVVAWLEKAQISEGIWAYQYDVETGEPIYLTRDGERSADPSIMSEHDMLRWWTSGMGLKPFLRAWSQIKEIGGEHYLNLRERPISGRELSAKKDKIRRRAIAAMELQRPEGYWIEAGVISNLGFVVRSMDLMVYLESEDDLIIPPCDVCPKFRWYRYSGFNETFLSLLTKED